VKGNTSLRRDNFKGVKKHRKIIKIFLRTSKQFSIKLGANLCWVKRIQVYSNKGPIFLLKGEIITKMQKWDGII
jgi:hypothetical protein